MIAGPGVAGAAVEADRRRVRPAGNLVITDHGNDVIRAA
jgi:hypothetical protein